MVTKRGPGRPPKKRRGGPKGSKNKIFIHTLKGDLVEANKAFPLEYIKDYNETPSFRSRLEAATIKFEQAVNETIEQLKGKM